MTGHTLVVTGHNFDGDATARHGAQGVTGTGFGRVQKGGKPGEHQFTFIRHHGVRVVQGHIPPGNAQHPKALFTQLIKQGVDVGAGGFIKQSGAASGLLVVRAQAQDVFRRTLDHQATRLSALHQHRDAAPFKVKGHLVHLAPVRDINVFVGQDGIIQRALQAALERAVEVGQRQHLGVVSAIGAHMAFKANSCLGEGAGFVGAQHIHRPHVLNGGGALDNHLHGGHAQGPPREGDGYHHGQQFRR